MFHTVLQVFRDILLAVCVLHVFHNVLQVFDDVLRVFYNVLCCLVIHATIGIADRRSPQGSAITPQK